VLPASHLSEGSRDTVKLMTGLMATLSALVLGLLIASAKEFYDRSNEEFRQIAVKVVLLDRALAEYGPETQEVRHRLRDDYKTRIDQLFPATRIGAVDITLQSSPRAIEDIESRLRALMLPSDAHQAHMNRALQLLDDLARAGWVLTIDESDTSLPPAMLVVLVSWLAAMFLGFGLLAPRNATAIAALLLGSLAVSTSIFLIEEMGHPLQGVIRISAAPMRNAIDFLGR
jgi:hypothetical protein